MSGVLMMLEPSHNSELPPIPSKRYFTIGEVSDLCAVKPHVLRYCCLLYTSPSPRDGLLSRMPSSA